MKKNIGDRFTTLSPFGYVFSGTVTGIIQETPHGNIYQGTFDGPGRELEEGESIEYDTNTYFPPHKPGSEIDTRKARIIPAEGKYN